MAEVDHDRHGWEQPGAFEVAPGVHRIPLPLPGDGLKAVNVYALSQPDGLVLIDAGWALDESRAQLEAGLAVVGHDLGDVRRVLVTHVHRDHYELGMHLRRLFGSRLALGLGEQPSLRSIVDEPSLERGLMPDRMAQAGASALVEQLIRLRHVSDSPMMEPVDWELPDEWLQDGQVVDLGARRIRVVATPGHTKGHVVFVDEAAGLLFSGDHVLPHITPSIGFEALPVDSALADYLASLALVRAMPDLRMLPAHGPVRPTTHDRIDALLAHHEDRLRASYDVVAAGASTGMEAATALSWTRRERAFSELDPFNQLLAVNETVAHLDVLVRRELLTVDEEDGVRRFRA